MYQCWEHWERGKKKKKFLFSKKVYSEINLQKVIRFVCVIYCFLNTFERNLFSIGGLSISPRLIPNHFYGFSTDLFLSFYSLTSYSLSNVSRINLKGDGSSLALHAFNVLIRILMWMEIQLHNLCFRLANGHSNFTESCWILVQFQQILSFAFSLEFKASFNFKKNFSFQKTSHEILNWFMFHAFSFCSQTF